MTAVRTISAVNTSTDELTITAHGLNTGDGFLRVYTPNGTIPGGLAAATDLWAIRSDANNIQLATSSANAVANIPINITSTGSGTLELLQGPPYAVPRIAAPGTQVFSADDNDTWNALVAIWNLLTGQAQSVFSAVNLAVPLTADLKRTGSMAIGLRNATGTGFVLGSFPFTWTFTTSSTGGSVVIDFNLPDNVSITDISWDYQCSATGVNSHQTTFLQEVDVAGVATTLITAAGNSPSTANVTYKMSTFASVTGGTVTGSLPIVSDGLHSYRFEFSVGPVGASTTFTLGGSIVLTLAYG